MFRRLAAPVLALALLTLTGCYSGGGLHRSTVAETSPTVWSDLARLEFSKDARIEFPARMVVVDESSSNWRERTQGAEAQRLERVVERLGHERDALSYVSPLFGADLERARRDDGEDWRRMAAAQHEPARVTSTRRPIRPVHPVSRAAAAPELVQRCVRRFGTRFGAP